MTFSPIPIALPLIQAGKLRPIGLSMAQRVEALPGVPPLADTLPGFELIVFFGLYVPKGTDAGVIHALYQAARAGAEREDFKRNLANQGFEIRTSSPSELAAFSTREIERWAQMVREAKIDPE
jgi:tripartite-type tricarboxylate transporter receptor subunit TctC